MADPFRCIDALKKAAGKQLTPDEAIEILQRVQQTAEEIKAGRIKSEGLAALMP